MQNTLILSLKAFSEWKKTLVRYILLYEDYQVYIMCITLDKANEKLQDILVLSCAHENQDSQFRKRHRYDIKKNPVKQCSTIFEL